MTEIPIIVVEDEDDLRQAIVGRLSETEGFDCIASVGTGAEAIQVCLDAEPRIVLMDINLPDISGVECVVRILDEKPDCQILMYTAFEDSHLVFDSLKAGAAGYIVKHKSFDELVAGIRDVLEGGAPMTPRIARKVVRSFRPEAPVGDDGEPLTDREQEILNLVAQGLQNKEVARELNISPDTVRVHLRNIYSKWQVRNRAEATAKYLGN